MSEMGPLARLGVAARRGFGRVTPDPFVLAVGLTLVVLIVAFVFGDWPALSKGGQADPSWAQRFAATLDYWSGAEPADAKGHRGLWRLLDFGMQMVLMLVLGTALAEAPPVRRAIESAARLAKGPRTLVAVTAFVSIALGLLSWSMSLIGGALLAREAGRLAKSRDWQLHYPILCAAAYTGLMCWHGGLSGTAPLKATTQKDMVGVLGESLAARVGTISLDQSLLSPMNLFVGGGLLVLGPLLFAAMTPKQGEDPDPRPAPAPDPEPEPGSQIDALERAPTDTLEKIERSTFVVWMLGLPLLCALLLRVSRKGIGQLDIDTLNLALWVLALVLHGKPDRFVAACSKGIRSCAGIVLQFPLYAGIMAVMAASGLSALATAQVSAAGPDALPLLTFSSAGLLNLLVPSGGGQWAVQGPIIMEAALETGVAPGKVLMAMAYGDQWTNMLQPFWALPLLALTGVRARDIIGYTALWLVAGGLWMIAALLLF